MKKEFKSTRNFFFKKILLGVISLGVIAKATASVNHIRENGDEYIFNPGLFKGGNFDQSILKALSKPESIAPGEYDIDVFVNKKLLGNYLVIYALDEGVISPCFPYEMIKDIGFKKITPKIDEGECLYLSHISPEVNIKNHINELKVEVTIPQSLLLNRPRDYVSPSSFQFGSDLGFLNYLANYYHVSYSGSDSSDLDSMWLSLNGGVNLGGWQYRQIGNASWSKESDYRWNSVRSYVQRPLVNIDSQFMAGQLVTNGKFFSGMNYVGLNLSSAEAMLPQSQRGYAPVINGVANSNALVTIKQNGQEIYQTSVPPGAFEINDLYPTSNSGDLFVEIAEADGAVKNFIVPFSALPESIRPGMSKYNLALGRVRDTDVSSMFSDLVYQRGITNAITVNGGVRLAEGYMASAMGAVYGSSIGAIGIDTTFSHSKMPNDQASEGWVSRISWSKAFQGSGTTLSFASYKYSTSGYRDLISFLGERNRGTIDGDWLGHTDHQRDRFDLTLSQGLGKYGSAYINAATQSYKNDRSRDTQVQFGYSKSLSHHITMNVSANRQRVGGQNNKPEVENAISVAFSMPLFSGGSSSSNLSTSYHYSDASGGQYQVSASGVLSEDKSVGYNVNAIRDQKYKLNVFSGSLQKRLPKTTISLSASKGNSYWQMSGNMQGAMALHSGGVTFGPYLGDTFALVEAKGAEGAELFSSTQTRIDSNGYALVSALTPYRYNNISLDPQGMNGNAEILNTQKRVVPVAGSSLKVTFKTRLGTALLITVATEDGLDIPMGAQVYNDKNESIGMVGQGSQVYARVEEPSGKLTIKWDEQKGSCVVPYKISQKDMGSELLNVAGRCVNDF